MAVRTPKFGEPLSRRELQVGALLIEGKGDKIIAAELGIATRTAKLYVWNLKLKLGAESRTSLAVKFARRLDARRALSR